MTIKSRFDGLKVQLAAKKTNRLVGVKMMSIVEELKECSNFDASRIFHDLCDALKIFNETFTFHVMLVLMNLVVS
jgi:hypothetical protein